MAALDVGLLLLEFGAEPNVGDSVLGVFAYEALFEVYKTEDALRVLQV